MTDLRSREEAVNIQLAVLISRFGVTADGETIHVHGKHRPDVLFELRGLRVVIEGKLPDHANAEAKVLEDARNRVQSGLAHIAVAVIYPIALRTVRTTKLIEELEKSHLRFRIVAETHESKNWLEASPVGLMDALRRVQEALTKDDIVEQTAKALSEQLETVARLWNDLPGACDRLSNILRMIPPKDETKETARDRRSTAARVAALVLANAYIFQEQLARADKRVDTLRKLAKSKDIVAATSEHWHWIWDNINYISIFQLGERY